MNEENVSIEMGEAVTEETELLAFGDGEVPLEEASEEPFLNEDVELPEEDSEKSAEADEVAALKEELEALRAQLKAREEEERATLRMNAELFEFEEYFPEVELASIPDEIWKKVKSGASLSASFALFKRREELKNKRISDLNTKNRKMSAGSIAGGEGEKYFSPSEVKRMTPEQVKSNYDRILESMRHWN